jgi:peptidoglycan/xylan/chitin deacetylase (PgdA/CDA1 family)
MKSRIRKLAKGALYRSGALGFFHSIRNEYCLTVVMFHRVLPPWAPDYEFADPLYSVTPEFLRLTVKLLKANYSIVSADDVLCSLKRERPLPPHPLLITFDDGWSDNLKWAQQELRETPWTLFVTTGAISEPGWWWQEFLLWTIRTGQTTHRELLAGIGRPESGHAEDALDLLIQFSEIGSERRSEQISNLQRRLHVPCPDNQMLSWGELHELREQGVTLGSHGASHLPLSRLDDPYADLKTSVEALGPLNTAPIMSFPHGRYGPRAVEAARAAGFRALFTSDPVLNPCPDGWLKSDLIGRISVDSGMITARDGNFAPQELASNIFLRNVVELGAAQ